MTKAEQEFIDAAKAYTERFHGCAPKDMSASLRRMYDTWLKLPKVPGNVAAA